MCITAVSWLSQDITAASHTASGWRIGLVGWFAPRLNTTSYTQLEQHRTILHATNHIYDVCDPRHLQAITSTLNGNYVPAQNLHETVLWWWWWRLIILAHPAPLDGTKRVLGYWHSGGCGTFKISLSVRRVSCGRGVLRPKTSTFYIFGLLGIYIYWLGSWNGGPQIIQN